MRERPPIFDLNHSSSPLARGLAAGYLGCGPGTGMCVDSSINRKHGLLTNMDPATDWVFADELGRWATDFDKLNDYVTAPFVGSFVGSISVWVNLTSITHIPYLFDFRIAGGTGYCYITATTAAIQKTSGTSYVNGVPAAALATSGWCHLCINGITIASSVVILGQKNDLANNYTLHGKLSDFCIWNRALSPSEISAAADPWNRNLSCGGVPLIREPRPLRGFIGQAGGGGAATFPWLWRRNSRVIGASA